MCFFDLVGGVAQMGARLNGIQKVVGSIPIVSTIFDRTEKFGSSILNYNE